jgi:hypothetical protein
MSSATGSFKVGVSVDGTRTKKGYAKKRKNEADKYFQEMEDLDETECFRRLDAFFSDLALVTTDSDRQYLLGRVNRLHLLQLKVALFRLTSWTGDSLKQTIEIFDTTDGLSPGKIPSDDDEWAALDGKSEMKCCIRLSMLLPAESRKTLKSQGLQFHFNDATYAQTLSDVLTYHPNSIQYGEIARAAYMRVLAATSLNKSVTYEARALKIWRLYASLFARFNLHTIAAIVQPEIDELDATLGVSVTTENTLLDEVQLHRKLANLDN